MDGTYYIPQNLGMNGKKNEWVHGAPRYGGGEALLYI